MTDTAFSGGAPAASSDDRNLALVSYALLFAAPFVFGLTALIAVVIAYVRKPEAEPVTASHYRYQIRIFWIGFALSMVAVLALMVGVGFLMVEVVKALVMNAPADAWEAVAWEVEPAFPAVFFIGLIVFLAAYAASSLWLILSSIVGMVRLGGHHPAGRLQA